MVNWKSLLCTILLLATSGCYQVVRENTPVISGDGLNWRCSGRKDTVQLTAQLVSDNQGVGQVSVGGLTHEAEFRIAGFDRRWDFGGDVGKLWGAQHNYAFVIRPDGVGGYYDFSIVEPGEATGPKRVYDCVSP